MASPSLGDSLGDRIAFQNPIKNGEEYPPNKGRIESPLHYRALAS